MKKLTSVALAAIMLLGTETAGASILVHESLSYSHLLGSLPVSPETATDSYVRDYFKHWIDADGDGCDTRAEVLQQESLTKIGCNLKGGRWVSLYDGIKTANASTFDIDHFVPLKEAWESGAYAWDSATRESFANDLDYSVSLIAVTASSNRSKSDRDPAAWLPRSSAFNCQYVGRWVAVKYRWSLSVDAAEKKVLSAKLSSCGAKSKVAVPAKATIVQGDVPSPTPSVTATPTASGAVDPRFASCAEAKRNGYDGPYKKGLNPEYDWYDDRDKDGIVCES